MHQKAEALKNLLKKRGNTDPNESRAPGLVIMITGLMDKEGKGPKKPSPFEEMLKKKKKKNSDYEEEMEDEMEEDEY